MNYITIDLETTGVSTLTDVPIQIAWEVRNSAGAFKTAGSYLVNAGRPVTPFIQELTGITQSMIQAQGLSSSKAAQRYMDLVWNCHPACLVGYNIVNFDLPILQNFLATHIKGRFKFPPIHAVYDAMFLFQKYTKTKKWTKLAKAAEKLKIDFKEEDLHDAREDVRLTWLVFDFLRKEGVLNGI